MRWHPAKWDIDAAWGRASFMGKDDVNDVAVAVLLHRSAHVGGTYTLTGPRPAVPMTVTYKRHSG